MKLYHERQSQRKCTLHALNNMLQRPAFTCADMTKVARKMCKGKRAEQKMYDMLVGAGGFYSPTLAFALLNDNEYVAQRRKTRPRSREKGMFFVTGILQSSGAAHSIAITRGHVVDSMQPAPIPLPATAYFSSVFTVGDVYSVRRKPASVPLRKKPVPVIDLTEDDD